MKKNPDLADIPIILLTNLNDAETVSRALAMGLNDYLVKTDWKLQDIVKLVREKIGGWLIRWPCLFAALFYIVENLNYLAI